MSKVQRPAAKLCVLLLTLAALGVACTNDALDDGDSADVVLEIESLRNPPVSASLDLLSGGCAFTVQDWSFGVTNRPKNSVVDPSLPFNDISLLDVTVDYEWIDPGLVTPQRVIGLGGVVVPANDTATVTFQPIAFDDLSVAHQAHTAQMTLTFRAVTVEGTPITQTVTRGLSIESCS